MNELFLQQMQDILKEDYPEYLKCLDHDAIRGFRINSLKTSESHFFENVDVFHEKSPYALHGYYTDDKKYGMTPAYLSGAFYMQEASASAAVTVMDPKPGFKILDLCAAPGSKTTQILELLNNDGLVVCNEIDHKRSKILLENVERNGASNCVVLNNDTKDIAKHFQGYFDMVLCDAPCSGEGMMRKNTEAVDQWSPELVRHCASLQKEILENAYLCLKENGILLYSTCTLNKLENEKQISAFLEKHVDMEMIDADVSFGRSAFEEGHETHKAIRIYPMDKGEGHFIAKMRKKSSTSISNIKELKSDKIPNEILKLLENTLEKQYPCLYYKNNRLYGGSHQFMDTGRLHLLRNQVYIGEMLKGRFEFSHHFFMSSYSKFKNKFDLNDNEVKMYMHGEQISANVQKGWYAMCYHGFVIGGAKSDGKALKNKFPKAFRLR